MVSDEGCGIVLGFSEVVLIWVWSWGLKVVE
jgi:hypothetical protein